MEGKPLTVNGDGSTFRDWTYIDNVVDANLRAATAPGVSGEVFNIACGATLTLNEVIDELRSLIGVQGDISYGPPRAGDMPKSLASTEKAKRLLGYEPLVGTHEGLRRTVAWCRDWL